jgi:pilus assembly protein CpaB
MRASRIILLVVALLAGGLAAYLATRGNQPPTVVAGPATVIQEAKEQVLVAATQIGVGQRLTEGTVSWQDWPQGAVRPEYVTKAAVPDALESMKGAIARFEFFPGEPILDAKLVHSDEGYLSAVLAKGMRGVSVQVSADSAAGGYIVPNDRVDVVLTHSGLSGQVSETILADVKVLAIGLRLGEAGTTGAPEDPDDPRSNVFQSSAIATLELTPSQAETIINGSKVGSLSLVLRSIVDFASTPSDAVDTRGNKAIRVVRYGVGTDVMAGTPAADAGDVGVDPASYVPETSISDGPSPEALQ